MQAARDSHRHETPALGWARRMLRRQLGALAHLAAVARRLIERGAEAAADSARPLAGAAALERAVRGHARAAWALRLMAALRARLIGDLARIERGEAPATPKPRPERAPEPAAPVADAPAPLTLAQRIAADLERLRAELRGELPLSLKGLEIERPETERFEHVSSPQAEARQFAEILRRPTDEVLALIARELGLPPDWLDDIEEAFDLEEEDEAPEAFFPLDGRSALSDRPRPSTSSG